MKRILVVGAGLSGSVIAHELANSGYNVDIFEARDHIGGNCYTYKDDKTNIEVHKYGPHIFHTDKKEIWDYVCGFTEFHEYKCQVKATTRSQVFSLPINLHTINQFFGKTLSPNQAREFIKTKTRKINDVISFEDQALAFVGDELYEAFFKGYPIKQWGVHPSKLPASILKRLPLRFDYNDNYFEHEYQGIPVDGYTAIFEKMLSHPNIKLHLNKSFEKSQALLSQYDHVFYSGPLDRWFDYSAGRLGYRTLRFESSYCDGDYQGTAVMSYPEEKYKFTRITEHKYFTPWIKFDSSIVFHEFSDLCKEGDEPYYPIRLVDDELLLKKYMIEADNEKGVTFVGRLGTYRYLDMDVTIYEALRIADEFKKRIKSNDNIPSFFNRPIV